MHPGEQFRIAKAGRGLLLTALALGEGAQRVVSREARARVAHHQRLQCVPDAALPVDQGAVAVEREDTEVGQSPHSLVAISFDPFRVRSMPRRWCHAGAGPPAGRSPGRRIR